MSITVNMPEEIERQLRAEYPDLDRRVVEGFVVEAFRSGELSSYQIQQILGFEDRWQTIEFLSQRGVYPNYEMEELEEEHRAMDKLFSNQTK